jgi:hypothetical protein
MGKKKASSSKLKEVLVDEEEALKVIENQEFIAMRATKKIWPSRLPQKISCRSWSVIA